MGKIECPRYLKCVILKILGMDLCFLRTVKSVQITEPTLQKGLFAEAKWCCIYKYLLEVWNYSRNSKNIGKYLPNTAHHVAVRLKVCLIVALDFKAISMHGLEARSSFWMFPVHKWYGKIQNLHQHDRYKLFQMFSRSFQNFDSIFPNW